jgi:hypothetical protein
MNFCPQSEWQRANPIHREIPRPIRGGKQNFMEE